MSAVAISALGTISAAFYDLLNVPAFVAVCTGGVFSVVPQGTVAPYTKIVVRERTSPLSTFGRMNQSLDVRVGLYSEVQGTDELDDMTDVAVPLLHHAVPTLTGWQAPLIEYLGSAEIDDALVAGKRVFGRQLMFDVSLVQA